MRVGVSPGSPHIISLNEILYIRQHFSLKGFIVKILDCDMKAREFTVFSLLEQLEWANIPMDTDIKTLHGETIGFMEFCGI